MGQFSLAQLGLARKKGREGAREGNPNRLLLGAATSCHIGRAAAPLGFRRAAVVITGGRPVRRFYAAAGRAQHHQKERK
jgi:hypothetical protein